MRRAILKAAAVPCSAFRCIQYNSDAAPGQRPLQPPATTMVNLRPVPNAAHIALIELNNPPVNILTSRVLDELHSTLRYLGNEQSPYRGAILASTSKTVFSAGLDLDVLASKDRKLFGQNYSRFQHIFIELNEFCHPIVAMVAGKAPGGGCVYATCCDAIYMLDCPNAQIGITASRAGFALPGWAADSLARVAGPKVAERMLQLGKLIGAHEAYRVGIADALAPTEDVLLQQCVDHINGMIASGEFSRWYTKEHFRLNALGALATQQGREADEQWFFEMFQQPEIAARLAAYRQGLRRNPQKPPQQPPTQPPAPHTV